mgnify:FL=1
MKRLLVMLFMLVALSGCAQERRAAPSAAANTPTIVMPDNTALPLQYWAPSSGQSPQAIVLGIHGFNDYAGGFSATANALTEQGIGVYAWDQRGFGGTGSRGRWPGTDTLVNDAGVVARAIKTQHPEQPFYLMGHSMGAAVTTLMLEQAPPIRIAGTILVAPAFWARRTMPWYQRWALWAGKQFTPWLTLTGEGLGIEPTDDPAVRAALANDPYWIRDTRVDALAGVVDLMDSALRALPPRPAPPRTLLLFGLADQVIPQQAACAMVKRYQPQNGWHAAVYPSGYHMLTRYSGAEQTLSDLSHFVLQKSGPLPSGYEANYAQTRRTLCADASTPSSGLKKRIN